jgi:hypothetical protein
MIEFTLQFFSLRKILHFAKNVKKIFKLLDPTRGSIRPVGRSYPRPTLSGHTKEIVTMKVDDMLHQTNLPLSAR